MAKDEKEIAWEDPIVAEVRAVRDEHARQFDYDLSAIFKDLIGQQEEHIASGWEYVRLPAKRVETRQKGTNR